MADRILIDTGPIVALFDKNDQHHDACREAAQELPEILWTVWPVITEACYLLRKRPDLVESLLEAVHEGDYQLLTIRADEVIQVGGVLSKYRDQELDLADACLAYMAERENISTVFTVDKRHFSLFRLASGDALSLVPLLGS